MFTMELHDDGHESAVVSMLQELRLPYMAADFEKRIRDPLYMGDVSNDPQQFVRDLVTEEHWRRIVQRTKTLRRKACLRYPDAVLDDALKDPERDLDTSLISLLSECRWVMDGQDLIITGMTGTGKTYLANALAGCALNHGLASRYMRAGDVLRELEAADTLGTLPDTLKKLSKFDLLVIDDFGLMKLDLDKCRNLFELIDSRTTRLSTMIVSQIPVSGWYDLFSNATYADAVLDRLTHQAYRLQMNGPSMRRKNLPAASVSGSADLSAAEPDLPF